MGLCWVTLCCFCSKFERLGGRFKQLVVALVREALDAVFTWRGVMREDGFRLSSEFCCLGSFLVDALLCLGVYFIELN
jgi:hypothetical protein